MAPLINVLAPIVTRLFTTRALEVLLLRVAQRCAARTESNVDDEFVQMTADLIGVSLPPIQGDKQ